VSGHDAATKADRDAVWALVGALAPLCWEDDCDAPAIFEDAAELGYCYKHRKKGMFPLTPLLYADELRVLLERMRLWEGGGE
jgi:hypothetical protein